MLFKHKYAVIYGMVWLIGACLTLAFIRPFGTTASNWVTSAGLLLDVLGLAQLEISGVFDGIITALMKANDEGLAPSRLVREVIDNPDEAEWRRKARWWLMSGPKTGVQLIVLGCVFQLIGTWLQ